MNKVPWWLLVVICIILGSCTASRLSSRTAMTQKNHLRERSKQAPINSTLYAKRYWGPKTSKRKPLLSFRSKKRPERKAQPKPEYTHQ